METKDSIANSGRPLPEAYETVPDKARVPSAYERSVQGFRGNPAQRAFVEKNYLEEDLGRAVLRYAGSDEFRRVGRILARHLPPGGCLLDVGAGRGLSSLALAQAGFRVFSVEYDSSALVGIGALAGFLAGCALPLTLIRADALALPFRDAFFDVVFCRSLLHHLDDLKRGLREISRVLKPGGCFIACNEHIVSIFSNGTSFRRAHPAMAYGVNERAYQAWRYRWQLRKSGFRRIHFFGYPLDFSEFLEATGHNPIRSRLASLHFGGRCLARVFYALHVIWRAYLSVPEEKLPAVNFAAQKGLKEDR